MTTYDVLVADELLPEFSNDNPRMPEGFRILGPVDGQSVDRVTRFRVEDDTAPDWTEGKLIDPTFGAEYEADDQGKPNVVRMLVVDWREVTA